MQFPITVANREEKAPECVIRFSAESQTFVVDALSRSVTHLLQYRLEAHVPWSNDVIGHPFRVYSARSFMGEGGGRIPAEADEELACRFYFLPAIQRGDVLAAFAAAPPPPFEVHPQYAVQIRLSRAPVASMFGLKKWCEKVRVSVASAAGGPVPWDALYYQIGADAIRYPLNQTFVQGGGFTLYLPFGTPVRVRAAEGAPCTIVGP